MELMTFFLWGLFFITAFIYSMAGFGGGSTYLAVLVLTGISYQNVRPIALFCNLIVTAISFAHFYRAGYFRFHKIFPFLILSVPMAFFGGSFLIDEKFFRILLGVSLLAAAFRIFLPEKSLEETRPVSTLKAWGLGLPIGGFLGFLSGLVGIGGGIFLSPLLLLMRWVKVKEAAAGASFFIFMNSLAGLSAQFYKGWVDTALLFSLGPAVFLGGLMGSRLSAYHLPKPFLEKVLSALIFYVSVKLLWGV